MENSFEGSMTLTGNGSNSLTIEDIRTETDSVHDKTITVTGNGAALNFREFGSFVLDADFSKLSGSSPVPSLYAHGGGTLSFREVSNISLGTEEKPLQKAYALEAHNGTIEAKNFKNFEIHSSHGIWVTTSSGGKAVVDIDGGETGDINIQTKSFAVYMTPYYSNRQAQDMTLTLVGRNVVIESAESRALDLASGHMVGEDVDVTIKATDRVVVRGATNGIQAGRNNDATSTNVTIIAGSTITIEGGENAITEMTGSAATNQGSNFTLTAPMVSFEGNVNAANSTITMNGAEGDTAVAVNFTNDFLVDTLNTAEGRAFTLNGVFDEEMGSIDINHNSAEYTSIALSGTAVNSLSMIEADDYAKNDVMVNVGTEYDVSLMNAAWELNRHIDAEGNGTTTYRASDLSKSSMDIVALSMMAWRNETTTINDRMASLRGDPAQYGAWVRWNGGEYQYDARNVDQQFNTIEVGGDTRVNPNWTIGASFSYTKGDGDFEHGETDSDTYAGALYALWTHEKGSFVDVVAKAGKLSTDFDFHGISGVAADHGELEMTGFIFGVETGHRFTLPMNTFVEPQIQLTYSSLGSDSTTTATRHIDIESTDSLIGRIGVMAGFTCPNDRGSAYVRVSALHDFQGDIKGTFRARNNPDAITITEELDDTWMEFAVGADFKVSDTAVLFADVQKSTGGEIDLDWRANIGAKFLF